MSYNTKNSPFHIFEKLDYSLETWINFWYPNICDYVNISPDRDRFVLKRVSQLFMSNIQPATLSNLLKNKFVCIVAPGYSLEKYEKHIVENIIKNKEKNIIISVDGATTVFFKHDIQPDIIVTDLDGNVEHQLYAQKEGSILLVHVHGDNAEMLDVYMPEISKRGFMLTTQTRPYNTAYNFYGFSDGDRAVSLCKYFNAKQVKLVGYDFGNNIGVYSKKIETKNNAFILRKMKKFLIAKSVINWCENASLKISKNP